MQPRKYSQMPTAEKVALLFEKLLEKKAQDAVAFDLTAEKSLFEAAIIAGAGSLRHAQGLADFVLASCKEEKLEYLHMEGYAAGRWILLDLNDVVVHILQDEAREVYRLDDLWPAAPVLADARKEA